MKKEEIIKLGDKEYTVTMNRETFIKINQVVNIDECMNLLVNGFNLIDKKENVDDDYDPYETSVDFDEMDKKVEEYSKKLEDFFVYGFHILLHPNHHLKISEVRELLNDYIKDEEKAKMLGEKYGEFLGKCIQIKYEYDEERKNLKAQANKK